MSRPCKCRQVKGLPPAVYFKPAGIPLRVLEEARLSVEEFEALRLADRDGLSMDEAACRMGVSRHTFGRIVRRARKTVASALAEGLALRVEGGCYRIAGSEESVPCQPLSSQE